MSAQCSLWVGGGGRYCCEPKVFRVGDRAVTVSLANVGPVDLLYYPTGDTDDVSVVHSTLEDGVHTLTDGGTYKFDLDCDAYDGVLAPGEVSEHASVCHTYVSQGDAASLAMLGSLSGIASTLEGLVTDGTGTSTDVAAVVDQIASGLVDMQAALESVASSLENLEQLAQDNALASLGMFSYEK